jgi:hypothetical protein
MIYWRHLVWMAGNFSPLSIPIRLRSWGVRKRRADLDLVGQRLPRLGHSIKRILSLKSLVVRAS